MADATLPRSLMEELMQETIDLVIFDLGNVIFEALPGRAIQYWSQHASLPRDHFADRAVFDEMFCRFERAEVTPAQYHQHFNRLAEVNFAFKTFQAGWNAIFGDLFQETVDLLPKLSENCQVVALSNTNVVHHECWAVKYEKVMGQFAEVFASSELGMRKPEERIYRHVLQACNTAPERSLFFDDLPENVAGAQQVGIHARQVSESADVIDELRDRRLI